MSVNGTLPNSTLSRNSPSPSPPSSLSDSSDDSSSDTSMSDTESDVSDDAATPADFPFEVLEYVPHNVFLHMLRNDTPPTAS